MIVIALLALLQPITCHSIKAEWITGKDLALAVPALGALPPDTRLSLAPVPGQRRVFSVSELKRIASVNHVETTFEEPACFGWDTAVPDRAEIVAAMEKTLASRTPKITLLEQSLMAAPSGELVFPLAGLPAGSDKPVVWRGFVRYGEKRQFPIWARVTVTVKERHLVAKRDLRCGEMLAGDQFQSESYEGPLERERVAVDLSQVEGMVLRRPLASGSTLTEDMLDAPQDVQRGDAVTAVVENGAARLEVQAVAEANGKRGEIISVRNPRSGRTFRARVEEKGAVVVVPGGQFGLATEPKKS